MRRGVYVIPSLVTLANLAAGVTAILFTVKGHFTSAAWCIIVGIIQLVILFLLRKVLVHWPVLLINGLLTAVLGIVIIYHPFEIADTVGKLVGIFSIVFGIAMIYLSFVIRKAVKAANKV